MELNDLPAEFASMLRALPEETATEIWLRNPIVARPAPLPDKLRRLPPEADRAVAQSCLTTASQQYATREIALRVDGLLTEQILGRLVRVLTHMQRCSMLSLRVQLSDNPAYAAAAATRLATVLRVANPAACVRVSLLDPLEDTTPGRRSGGHSVLAHSDAARPHQLRPWTFSALTHVHGSEALQAATCVSYQDAHFSRGTAVGDAKLAAAATLLQHSALASSQRVDLRDTAQLILFLCSSQPGSLAHAVQLDLGGSRWVAGDDRAGKGSRANMLPAIKTVASTCAGLLNLERLSVCHCGLDASGLIVFAECLGGCASLRALDISGVRMLTRSESPAANVQRVVPPLVALTQLRELSIAQCCLGVLDNLFARALLPALTALSALSSLDVSHNGLARGLGATAAHLALLSGLQRLQLSGNGIRDSGMAAAASHLASLQRLAFLGLAANQIESWSDLEVSLSGCTRLTCIEVDGNRAVMAQLAVLAPRLAVLSGDE